MREVVMRTLRRWYAALFPVMVCRSCEDKAQHHSSGICGPCWWESREW